MTNGSRKSGLSASLLMGKHEIISGLPEKLGGHDEGPGPHEILEAALTACTILTAQMVADRKGYKLESTDVVVKIEKEGTETLISREVKFRGALSEEERSYLATIVEKCPIHKLLTSHVSIETKVI